MLIVLYLQNGMRKESAANHIVKKESAGTRKIIRLNSHRKINESAGIRTKTSAADHIASNDSAFNTKSARTLKQNGSQTQETIQNARRGGGGALSVEDSSADAAPAAAARSARG